MAVLPPESIHAPSKNGGNSGKSGKTLNAADGKIGTQTQNAESNAETEKYFKNTRVSFCLHSN